MSMMYFEAKHATLGNDYHDETGLRSESCWLIARELADLLRTEGKLPRLLSLRGQKLDASGNPALLVPKPYEGRVHGEAMPSVKQPK